MASSIRLALQGYEVSVFEKNTYPGGKLSAFQLGAFSFDAGPSLFTAPHLLEDLFAEAQVPMDDFFSYRKLEIKVISKSKLSSPQTWCCLCSNTHRIL